MDTFPRKFVSSLWIQRIVEFYKQPMAGMQKTVSFSSSYFNTVIQQTLVGTYHALDTEGAGP